MKIRFLYHKPKGERGIGKLIVSWTWVLGCFYNWDVLKYNYSHEEVWIPDKNGNFIDYPQHSVSRAAAYMNNEIGPLQSLGPRVYTGQCFSSTTRGTSKGVRFAPASEVLHNAERWDYIEVEVDRLRLDIALEQGRRMVNRGVGYDFLGVILGFSLPGNIQNEEKKYCSELMDWFKVLVRVHRKRTKPVSPRRSAYLMARKYKEPKPLLEK